MTILEGLSKLKEACLLEQVLIYYLRSKAFTKQNINTQWNSKQVYRLVHMSSQVPWQHGVWSPRRSRQGASV